MKVLFLDIDGVLNTGSGYPEFETVRQLQRVVETTGCVIVISSAWRIGWSIEEIDAYLRNVGYTGPKPIGGTPDYSSNNAPRGWEIAAWIASPAGRSTRVFAIVDDFHASEFETVQDRLVQTKRLSGLDEIAADELIELLNEAPHA